MESPKQMVLLKRCFVFICFSLTFPCLLTFNSQPFAIHVKLQGAPFPVQLTLGMTVCLRKRGSPKLCEVVFVLHKCSPCPSSEGVWGEKSLGTGAMALIKQGGSPGHGVARAFISRKEQRSPCQPLAGI